MVQVPLSTGLSIETEPKFMDCFPFLNFEYKR